MIDLSWLDWILTGIGALVVLAVVEAIYWWTGRPKKPR